MGCAEEWGEGISGEGICCFGDGWVRGIAARELDGMATLFSRFVAKSARAGGPQDGHT